MAKNKKIYFRDLLRVDGCLIHIATLSFLCFLELCLWSVYSLNLELIYSIALVKSEILFNVQAKYGLQTSID